MICEHNKVVEGAYLETRSITEREGKKKREGVRVGEEKGEGNERNIDGSEDTKKKKMIMMMMKKTMNILKR